MEARRGILGIDATLDRKAAEAEIALRKAERFAGRHANLFAHEIEPGDHLADRVLDLNARVHLEKVKLVAGDEALDRTGRVVADRFGGAHPGLAHCGAHDAGNLRGRLFPQFLVAALQRTVALADVHDVTVLVRQHLKLDVLGILQVTFRVDRIVLEVRSRLAARGFERGFDLFGAVRDLESLTSAPRSGFKRQREPELFGGGSRARYVGDRFEATRYRRNVCRAHRLARAQLIAHRRDRIGVRSDPGQTGGDDAARELGILGEKPVSGMYGLRSGLPRDGDQLLAVEITLRR